MSPKFISVLETQLNNPAKWIFAQEANTLSALESQQTFNGISEINKASETYEPVNGLTRTITGNGAGGTINVVSHQLVSHSQNPILPLAGVKTKRNSHKKGTAANPDKKGSRNKKSKKHNSK